jgi:tetratricopeptide (TPR) repeat protein
MGEVHLAQDAELDRLVALKLFPPGTAAHDEAARRRLREARSSAALDHPFICKTYETGELDGRPFIAMEYVEGTTLKERLDTGKLPVQEAIRAAIEIADALDYAHRRGIVHRDLKPSNVMLTPERHVKLLDFGIARRLAAPGGALDETSTATTLEGQLLGTLAYMSPEQIEGRPADAQSDIFAFGLVLYEMLTGAHAHPRETSAATASAILTQPAPALSERLPDAPPVLEHVVKRMLARDRAERYQSAREVWADLASLLGGTGASSAAAAPAVAIPPPRRRRLAVPIAFAALVAVAAIAWFGWFRGADGLAFKERDWVLIADFENLTGDAAFDRALQTALVVGIEQSQYVNVVPQARIRESLRRMNRPDADRLDADLAAEVAVREGVRAVIAGSIAQVGGTYALTARLIDPNGRAAVLTESATAAGKDRVLSALDELATRVRARLGESLAGLEAQNRPLPLATTGSLEALSLFDEARRQAPADNGAQISLLQRAVALDPDFALAHADLGLALYLTGDRATGETHLSRALSLLDRLTTREQLWIRALADDTRGNRDLAVAHYKTYLSRFPDDRSGWFRLGWTYMAALNQPELGAEAFGRALAIDPSDSSSLVNLATCYSGMNRHREAVEAYEKAFALRPDFLTGQYINHEYGFTLVQLGEIDKGSDAFTTMTRNSNRLHGARGHRSLAMLEMYRGRYEAAVGHLREAILIQRAEGARLSEFRDQLFLATAHAMRGNRPASLEAIAAADRISREMTLAPNWLHLLGRAYARIGRVREAERALKQVASTAGDVTAASGISRSTRGDEVSVRLLRGEVALARGRVADAVAEFELADRLQPANVTREALATAYLAADRREDAARVLTDLLADKDLGGESQHDWLMAHVTLGEIYERLGRHNDARTQYEALLALWSGGDPDLPVARQVRDRLPRLVR